jgi:hypothetical protein
VPPSLDALHGRAAGVAGRRGKRDQLRSGHGVTAWVEKGAHLCR